jgi:cytochrome b561
MSLSSRLDGSGDRYTVVAIILHWVMALGILALAAIGLLMVHVHMPLARKFQLYQLHKSIGITILLAAVLRVLWRVWHKPPELPAHMQALEKLAARGGHLALYFFLFALPLSGWALVSASVLSIPTHLYGVIPWPHLPVLSTLHDKRPVEAILKLVHGYGAWTLLALVAGHAGAALRHHFLRGDDVLWRMIPWFRRPHSAPREQPEASHGVPCKT